MSLISINIDLAKDNEQYKVSVSYKGQYIGKDEKPATIADAIIAGQKIITKHFGEVKSKLKEKK